MASRKRPTEPQGALGLFALEPVVAPIKREAHTLPAPPSEPPPEFPIDTPIISERILRVVSAIVEDEVSVEPCADGRYLVSLVKHGGGTRAHVYWTRAQLEQLMRRIPPALEIG